MRRALVRLAYGECSAAAPPGKYRSVAELSRITGATEEAILGLGFMGRLGTARVEEGRLWLRPTLLDLDRWLPEYARARIACRKRWPLEDVAEVRDDHAGTACSRSTLRDAAEAGKLEAVRDRSGRLFARISEMRAFDVGLENALADAPEEWRSLDRSCWLRYEQLQERFPGLSRPTIKKVCRQRTLKQGRVAWYYVDAAAEAAFGHPTLEEAVGALGDDSLRLQDFYTVSGLSEELTTRFGRGSQAFVRVCLKGSNVLTVVGWRQAKPRPYDSVYIHVPQEVFAAGFDVVRDWLLGRGSTPAEATAAG